MASNFQFQLCKKRKILCPSCQHKTLVPYVNVSTNEVLHETTGKCDRLASCGYHYPPKEYFKNSGIVRPKPAATTEHKVQLPLAFIPYSYFDGSLQGYEDNNFIIWLRNKFPTHVVDRVVCDYRIGSSNSRWPGATVFWFITASGGVKAGQVKLFDLDGHTQSENSRKCTDWIHTVIKRKCIAANKPIPEAIRRYIDRGDYCTCLYGEHLLNEPKNRYKPVALCEAPKTAVIGSIYFPEYVWLATGSLSYLTRERCAVLKGRSVVLFPDLSLTKQDDSRGKAFRLWEQKAAQLADIADLSLDTTLEDIATNEDREKGMDLCDYLVRFDPRELAISDFKHGIMHDVREEEQLAFARTFYERGLTTYDLKMAVSELVDEYKLQIV